MHDSLGIRIFFPHGITPQIKPTMSFHHKFMTILIQYGLLKSLIVSRYSRGQSGTVPYSINCDYRLLISSLIYFIQSFGYNQIHLCCTNCRKYSLCIIPFRFGLTIPILKNIGLIEILNATITISKTSLQSNIQALVILLVKAIP